RASAHPDGARVVGVRRGGGGGGGGANFGIVTGFTFTTHRVDTASYFSASFDWDDVGDVVAQWQRWAPNAPPELFALCSLETGSGGPTLNVFGQYMGSA